jgi:hypothetical protein
VSSPLALTLSAAALLWALPSTARATPVVLHTQVDSLLTCPSEALVHDALEQRFGKAGMARDSSPPKGPVLEVRASAPGQIEIVFRDAGLQTRFQRLLAVQPLDCAQAAETVALLAGEWLREVSLPIERLEVSPPPHRAAPAPQPRMPPAAPPAIAEQASAEPAPVAEAPAAAATEPAAQTEPPPTARQPEAPPPGRSLQLAPSVAMGGFFDSGFAQAGIYAHTTLELRWGLLGLKIKLSVDGPMSVSAAPGQVHAQSQALQLLAGVDLFTARWGALAVWGGGGAERLEVRGEGFSQDRSSVTFLLVCGAGLRWRQRLWGPLFAVAGIGARARFVRPEIWVDGLGRKASLAPARPDLVLGLSWDAL